MFYLTHARIVRTFICISLIFTFLFSFNQNLASGMVINNSNGASASKALDPLEKLNTFLAQGERNSAGQIVPEGTNCSSPIVFDDHWSDGYRLVCQNNVYVLMVDLTNPAIKVEVVAASSGNQTLSSFADGNTIALLNGDYQYSPCSAGQICSQGLTISNGSTPSTYTSSHLCTDGLTRREIGFGQDDRVTVDWWYKFLNDSQAHSLCSGTLPGSAGGDESYNYNVIGGGPQFTFNGSFRWDCPYGYSGTTGASDCKASGTDVIINDEHFGTSATKWWQMYQTTIGYSSDNTTLMFGESNNATHTMQNMHDVMYQRLSTYGKSLGNAFKFDSDSKAGFWYYNSTYSSTPNVSVPNAVRIEKNTTSCYSLSTGSNPGGGGNVNVQTASNCAQGKYKANTNVTLSANANSGYLFSNWSGDASGSSNPITITMNGNKNVTANFSSPPSSFSKNTPANGSPNQSLSLTLDWGDSSGASSYEYCYDTTNDNACTNWIGTGTASQASISGLSYTTTYYWQVRATNSAGITYADGSSSAFWSFTTQNQPVQPPGAFSKGSPSIGATNQSVNLTLDWEDSSGASSYEYCFDTTNDNTCSTWSSSGSVSQASINGLSYNTAYYWQVRAVNTGGTTYADNNTWWSFTTAIAPPAAFAKSAPTNMATGVATSVSLSWGVSSGVTSYEYCYDTTNDDNCNSSWGNTGTNTSVSLSGLSNNSTYYWQVRAVNGGGTTYANSGNWWSFTTLQNDTTPPTLSWITPVSNSQVYDVLGQSIQLEVNTSDIGGINRVVFYRWDYVNLVSIEIGRVSNSPYRINFDTSTLLSGWNQVDAYSYDNAGNMTDQYIWLNHIDPAFSKGSPSNGTTGVIINPTLSWGSSNDATSYEYCIDTSNNNVCDTSWINVGNGTSVNLNGLTNGLIYFWQVRANNVVGITEANNSTWWSFTTSLVQNDYIEQSVVVPINGKIGMIQIGGTNYSSPKLVNQGYSITLLPIDSDLSVLSLYDVIVLPVGWAENGGGYPTLEAHASDYRAYVNQGGGLLIDQPNPFGQVGDSVTPTLLPYPITFNYLYTTADWPPIIVNSDHFLTRGLSPAELPGPADWITSIDPNYQVLVKGQSTNYPSLVTATYGQGRIVIQLDHPANIPDGTYGRMATWVMKKNTTFGSSYVLANQDATTSTSDPVSSCGGQNQGSASVWYQLKPGYDGVLNASTQGSNYDTVMSLWGGTPGNLTPISCNDDISGQNLTSKVTVDLLNSTNYYIEVTEKGTGVSHPGRVLNLSVDFVPCFTLTINSNPLGTGSVNTSILPNCKNGTEYLYNSAIQLTANPNSNYTFGGWTSDVIGSQNPVQTTISLNTNITANFTIINPPLNFQKSAPSNSAMNVVTNPNLSWTASSGATTYEYCIDTSNDNECSGSWISTGTGTNVSLTGLTNNTPYYWQVRSKNAGGTTYADGNAASFWSFTTVMASNPVPILTSLSPSSATLGGTAFTLTVNGTNFINGSVVRWNGNARTTTYVNSSQLTAAITAVDIATVGTTPVTVFNPTPGGGSSNAINFTINNPVPTITTLNPTSVIAGGAVFILTVNGTNFISSSVVRWNGVDRTTTYVNGTQLTASIASADIASAGTIPITVFNPTPGGGTSNAINFTVNNPVPTITTISPTLSMAGGTAFTLTVNGTNFINGSIVRWNGNARTTTYINATQLTASIAAADIATAGANQVTVFNPTPGGGTSNTVNFTVNNPVPTISTLSPSTATAGGVAFTLTVNGTNFISSSVVRWHGSARTTTYVNATQLTAAITAADITTSGTFPITVFNPTPGGGTSNAVNFIVNDSTITINTLSPSLATAGGTAFTLTVNGSGFITSSVVKWNASARPTTYVSSTQVTASITAADIAVAGTIPVTVSNASITSNAVNFTINNPIPTFTTLNPSSATCGGAAFTLTVNGTNFVNGSVVRWNGVNRTTTYVSSTQLTVAITAADIAACGTIPVTVFNPTPGGGTSNAVNFAINNPVPTITTLNPASAAVGGAAFTLTVNGTNFISSSVVRWNGNARTTTYVSATQLTAAITAADIAAAAAVPVTVFNPTPGGGTSNAVNFTVGSISPVVLAVLNPSTVTQGQNFDVTIEVRAGTQPVDGAAAYLNFDTTYLQVVSITPGITLTTILQNSYDNTSGQVNFSAGTFTNFPSGTFTLATITFHAQAATSSTSLTFNIVAPRKSDVTFAGNSVLNSTVGGSLEITNLASINGSVTLQGRPTPPDARWVAPLTVTLTKPGASQPAYTFTPTTDTSGHFSVSGIAPDTYEIRVKHSHTLRNLKTMTLAAGANAIDFGTLLEGDANDDGFVTLQDFSTLVTTYSKCQGISGYDPRADFNMDTCVTLLDFSLLVTNYGKGGDMAVTGGINPEGNNQVASAVSIRVDPPQSNIFVGDTFTVSILVQAGSQTADGAQVSLDFDPAKLQVKQITGNTALLPQVLQNTYDNTKGTLDYAAGTFSNFPSGNFTLVQIEFKAIGGTAGTSLSFHQGTPRNTDITFGGNSVLTTHQDGTVKSDYKNKVFLPMTIR